MKNKKTMTGVIAGVSIVSRRKPRPPPKVHFFGIQLIQLVETGEPKRKKKNGSTKKMIPKTGLGNSVRLVDRLLEKPQTEKKEKNLIEQRQSPCLACSSTQSYHFYI